MNTLMPILFALALMAALPSHSEGAVTRQADEKMAPKANEKIVEELTPVPPQY